MPIPKPKDDETESDFTDRCMANDTMNEEYPDNKQRFAICMQSWKDKDKEEDSYLPSNVERRFYPVHELRVTRAENQSPVIEGYAAVFNSLSEDLGGFREKIAPGAFKRAMRKSDTRALFNHDPNYVMGRKRAKTLSLKEDENGLRVKITPPDTQWARDLMVSVDRGDIDQMSFGFIVGKDEWEGADKKNPIRTLVEIAELPDVSIVTFPAYPDTSVALRSKEQWDSENKPPEATLEEKQETPSATATADPVARNRKLELLNR